MVKAVPAGPFPKKPGNARHVMRLSRLPDDEFREVRDMIEAKVKELIASL